MPALKERVTLKIVSMMAGDCAGDEKPRRGAPETKGEREQQAETAAACLEVR
jgi:hypothetical protein